MRCLEGKNAIVTGANRGLGLEIVREFAKSGANIYACIRKATAETKEVFAEISDEFNVIVCPVCFDVCNDEEVKNGLKKVFSEKKSIDILVNNAGVGYTNVFGMTPIQDIRNVFDVNFFAPLVISQIVLKKMIRQKSGSIINIASVQGLDSSAKNCAYGPSKAALISFTKCLASEVAIEGVRVNAIAPGAIDTDILSNLNDEELKFLVDKSASGRMAQPQEIAKVCRFLASDDASFINGQVVRVDGGGK